MSRSSNSNGTTTLCCCEYMNEQQERSHLLATCCNCVDLDESVDRLIVCDKVPFKNITAMKNTFQDRLRIPWRGGAKQVSLDAALPIILLPLLFYIASESLTCTIIIFAGIQIFMSYSKYLIPKVLHRTRFCYVWSVTSLVVLLMVFELKVVPLLEILPEENCLLVAMVVSALYCVHKVRTTAPLNFLSEDTGDSTGLLSWNDCGLCEMKVPPRSTHCKHCQACIAKKDHHSLWLDCCIGERNHRFFLLGVFFSFGSLLYGAILTLTSVCHPFFFLNIILLPDDCSDVYHDFEIALCFVSGCYGLMLAAGMLCRLSQQCWLVSLGVTGQEWRQMSRRWLGLGSQRGYTQGFWRNWANFFCARQ